MILWFGLAVCLCVSACLRMCQCMCVSMCLCVGVWDVVGMTADSWHLAFNRVPHCQVLDVDDSYNDFGEIKYVYVCVCE